MNLKSIKNNVMNYRITVLKILSTLIGLLFFISGISKIFNFDAFTGSTKKFLPFLSDYILFVGFLVITLEIFLGTMLFFRKRLKTIIMVLLLLLCLFIGVLIQNILLNNNIDCNCFGFLPFHYTLKTQLFIDIILLNMLLVLYFFNIDNFNLSEFKNNKRNWLIALIFYLFIQFGLVQFAISNNNNKEIDTKYFLGSVEKEIKNSTFNVSEARVFFLISVKDFSCPPCYDNFSALSDAINEIDNKLSVFYLFEKASVDSNLIIGDRFLEWKKIEGIRYPSFFITDSLFYTFTKKSCVLVLTNTNKIKFNEIFPMSVQKGNEIISFLKQ